MSRARGVERLRSPTIVAVMQAAHFGRHDDLASACTRSAIRGIFAQREMRSAPMVIGEIRAKDPTEMRLVEHDHVIETLATHRSNHAFNVGVLPRTAWARHDLGDPKAGDPAAHRLVIDAI